MTKHAFQFTEQRSDVILIALYGAFCAPIALEPSDGRVLNGGAAPLPAPLAVLDATPLAATRLGAPPPVLLPLFCSVLALEVSCTPCLEAIIPRAQAQCLGH